MDIMCKEGGTWSRSFPQCKGKGPRLKLHLLFILLVGYSVFKLLDNFCTKYTPFDKRLYIILSCVVLHHISHNITQLLHHNI